MDTWAKATPKDREALFNQTASAKVPGCITRGY
jgi:hypothetical protein